MKIQRVFLYISSFLFAFHWYSIMYLNSSYLNEFISEKAVSVLYMIGSIVTLLAFFVCPKIIQVFGLKKFFISLILLECISVFSMAFSGNAIIVGTFFVIHTILMPLVLFSMDIFLEHYTDTETITGGVRSLFLTLSNIPLVISPFIMGLIIAWKGLSSVYFYSLIFLVPLVYIIWRLIGDTKKARKMYSFSGSIQSILNNKNILSILCAHQLLQLYYAFMVIYTPIYLSQYIGFDWATIGVLFSIMLLPFVIFEIPAGKLADSRIGEKEILVVGFFIMTIATIGIYMLSGATFLPWAIILFLTRTGASLVEIASETYFFKKIKYTDSGLISIFRATRPVSFIVAPLIATTILLTGSFSTIFMVLSIIMFTGIVPSLLIRDTK